MNQPTTATCRRWPVIALTTLTGLALGALCMTAQAQSSTSNDTKVAQSGSGQSGTANPSPYDSGNAYSLLPYTKSGYVGLNIGRPRLNVSCGSGSFACDDPNASAYLYTGGLINDTIGAELGYLYTGSADRAGGTTRSQAVKLSLVMRAPLGVFNVFGKVGGNYGETRLSTGLGTDVTSGKARGWGASYSLGAGYDFNRQNGLVLEYGRDAFRYPGAGREYVDNLSVGYVYRF